MVPLLLMFYLLSNSERIWENVDHGLVAMSVAIALRMERATEAADLLSEVDEGKGQFYLLLFAYC